MIMSWCVPRQRCSICQQPVRKVVLPEMTGNTEWRADGPHIAIKQRVEYWCGCHPQYGELDE
jgi:hypothetical protein